MIHKLNPGFECFNFCYVLITPIPWWEIRHDKLVAELDYLRICQLNSNPIRYWIYWTFLLKKWNLGSLLFISKLHFINLIITQIIWQVKCTYPSHWCSEISKAQDRLTDLLQNVYISNPEYREIVRMILSTVGRGGEGDVGQRIRDEILVIQVKIEPLVTYSFFCIPIFPLPLKGWSCLNCNLWF